MASNFKEIETLDEPDTIDFQETAKFSRSENFAFDKPARCFFENTSKEELVLEHVLEYKR